MTHPQDEVQRASPDSRDMAGSNPLATPPGAPDTLLPRSMTSTMTGMIVGSTTLAIRCAQQLREAGVTLCAVLAFDTVLERWAAQEGILLLPSLEAVSTFLGEEDVDWLFSIVNPSILPSYLLDQVRRGTFNYHDAPLPRYAGTHATSWALLAGETDYAITWHRMASTVDAGELVVQQPVAIAPSDTALSLNLKCYQAASEGFAQLLNGLIHGALDTRPQDTTQRSFFPRHRRPEAAGCLSWHCTAQGLSRVVRALDLGRYHPNPLGRAKILLPQSVVLIEQLEVLDQPSEQRPGTLLEVAPNYWRIATADNDVIVQGLSDLTGHLRDAVELASQNDLNEGDQLPSLHDGQALALRQAYEAIGPHETFWAERLSRFHSRPFPFESAGHAGTTNAPQWRTSAWWASVALAAVPAQERVDHLLTAWGIYLARLTGEAGGQLGWHPIAGRSQARWLATFFASIVPMELDIDLDRPFHEVLAVVAAERITLERQDTFSRDLIARQPILQSIKALHSEYPWHIAIALVSDDISEDEAASDIALGGLLTLQVSTCDGRYRWIYDVSRLDEAQMHRTAQHLESLLHAAMSPRAAEIPVRQLNLLPPDERTLLLDTWNRTEAPYPADRCIHQLFEDQVRRAPEATALV
ncbi:formyltransferase family protein, partial [Burkholderia sp. Se-20378]|uniref:formyltransferase family protein n=1 Tax=Burkholderia sp. Se-20378 TaxID=2703899 RepID=UPI001EC8F413